MAEEEKIRKKDIAEFESDKENHSDYEVKHLELLNEIKDLLIDLNNK